MKRLPKIFLSAFIMCQVFYINCNCAELAPTLSWYKTWDGGVADAGYGAALHTTSNGTEYFYMTGKTVLTTDNCLTLKYNSSGDTLWQKIIDYSTDISGQAVALDENGYLYITGSYQPATYDILLVKYDADGNTSLINIFSATDGNDYGTGIAVRNNFIYITGYSDLGTDNIIITKRDSSGDTVWIKLYNTGNNSYGNAISVDAQGYVYVAGYSSVGLNDYITIKYDTDGNTKWIQTYDSGGIDEANGIALDGSGNVYVTGSSDNDILTIKYSSDGDTLWIRKSSGGTVGGGYGIKTDSNGYVYVTGSSQPGARKKITTIKYTSYGDTVWIENFGISGKDLEGRGIAVSDEGNIYITGFTDTDVITIKYTQNPVPGMAEPSYKGEVKIGSTGGKGIIYPGNDAIIAFKPTEPGQVIVRIYTMNGLLVQEFPAKTVTNIEDDANNYIQWACSNASGAKVSSGIYLVYVEGPGIKVTKKLAILR